MTRAIDAVTFKQMERVAQELLDEKSMAITGLGPLSRANFQLCEMRVFNGAAIADGVNGLRLNVV